MSGPLVTIVTPTLNARDSIRSCVLSIQGQTYREIEHIIVDGGSNDGTLEYAEAAGIAVIEGPDQGQSDAINKGFRKAKGEILGWLNADDVLLPKAVAAVVQRFEADPQIGWSLGDVVVASDAGAVLEKPAVPAKERTWRARNVGAQPGSFNQRWALEKTGLLDVSFHYMMDFELWLRMVNADIDCAVLDEILAVFSLHESSKSGSIPHWRFLCEDARARFMHGRVRDAGFAVGRAAAWLQREVALLEDDAVSTVMEAVQTSFADLSEGDIRSGFLVESAILKSKEGSFLAGARLLRPQILTHPTARSRISHVLGRALKQRKRRVNNLHEIVGSS